MPEVNLSRQFVDAKTILLVNSFENEVKSLSKLLGVHKLIPARIGDTINTYKSAEVTLAGGTVEPGAVIPLSEVKAVEGEPIKLVWDKRRKAVPVEDIQKYGYADSVTFSDKALLNEVRKNIRTKLFTNLEAGTGAATGEGLQSALAQGWGQLQVLFEDDAVEAVAFINPQDVADYLGSANISTQTAFGMQYLENFLGYRLVFLTAGVAKGTGIVTAGANLKLVYADVHGEISRMSLDYIKDETGLIGFARYTNPERLTEETVLVSGLTFFAERLDAVVKLTITEEQPASV